MTWFDLLFEYLPLFVSVVASVILFVRTKNVKYLKEVSYMIKYRTDPSKSAAPDTAQNFDEARFKKVYRLNKATGELELTDDVIDLQELIESFKDVALESLLERFNIVDHDKAGNDEEVYLDMVDDLDTLAEVMERGEQYRDEFGLDPALSLEEVYSFVRKRAEVMKQELDAAQKVQAAGNKQEGGEK